MNQTGKRQTELLAPAGSFDILKAVVNAGADAVYAAGNKFGARAYANNFSQEELLEAIDYMHLRDKKLYLTVNTLLKEKELENELYEYLLPLYRAGLDAVIVQDLGVLRFVKRNFPELPVHASTQMTITGAYGAKLMLDYGCSRIVTARELSLSEISDIYEKTGAEIESFVHGALCYCYSGQCLLSSMLGGRSGNRGRCAQPCRLSYELFSDKKEANASRKQKENYMLSPKDLCTIELLPQLIESGVHSFKIEGRMKQAEYAAGVTGIYRKYIDKYERNPDAEYKVSEKDRQKLLDLGNRCGFTDGYYTRQNGKDMITFSKPSHEKKKQEKENVSAAEEQKSASGELESKEKIKGILRLSKEFPARLVLEYKGIQAEVSGDVVQKAQKQPLSRETVCDKMNKTGNTPFVFEELQIEMEEDVFIPVGALNQLRRSGLEQLIDKILTKYRRNEAAEEPKKTDNTEKCNEEESCCHGADIQNNIYSSDESNSRKPCVVKTNGYPAGRVALSVLTETPEQFEIALQQPEVTRIYLEEAVWKDSRQEASGGNVASMESGWKNSRRQETSGGNTSLESDWKNSRRQETSGGNGTSLESGWKNSRGQEASGGNSEGKKQGLPECIEKARMAGKECYLAMPYIFRQKTAERFLKEWEAIISCGADGYLVRNLEELAFLKEMGVASGHIQGDYNLYHFSNEAKEALRELHLSQLTLPVELNRNELKYHDCRDCEMMIYGYQPLMLSAQCVYQNTQRCRRQSGTKISYLKDRYGKLFPVKNQCEDCYNIIYNSSPLSLLHHAKDICSLGISGVRISFTTEGRKEMLQIFEYYRKGWIQGEPLEQGYVKDFTNGHFRRGVE